MRGEGRALAAAGQRDVLYCLPCIDNSQIAVERSCPRCPAPVGFPAFQRYIGALGDDALAWEEPRPEAQRGEYESGLARVGTELWRLRTARITPTKPGAFVAVWERDEHGATQPFSAVSPIAGLMVFIAEGARFGVFRFDATHPALRHCAFRNGEYADRKKLPIDDEGEP